MFFLSLYWLLSPILWISLPVFSLFNPKLRHHWLYQKSTWLLADKRRRDKVEDKQVVLFHAASTGEFEQLKPILKKVDRSKYFILLTFFSPTIFSIEKETNLADAVCYHPFDFYWSAKLFFKKFNIKKYIITRNDIWPTHLFVAQSLGIKTILINANLYQKKQYNSWFMKLILKQIYGQFNLILTGSQRLKNNLLNIVPPNNIQITGDSRLDQVIELKSTNNSNLLPDCFKSSLGIILGSIIPSDYPAIFGGIAKLYLKGDQSIKERKHRLIIVPHELNLSEFKKIENYLTKIGITWSYYSENYQLENSQVVIIDKMGILANLYKYSGLAYIGAGFGAGVHSVLEPAIYNNMVCFGPNHQIVDMAVSMVEENLATIIKNAEDFYQFINLYDNSDTLKLARENMAGFIADQKLASENIINVIFN